MVAYFLLDENWHFFAFLCSTDTPSIKYHGRLLGPGPLFGTREYGSNQWSAFPRKMISSLHFNRANGRT